MTIDVEESPKASNKQNKTDKHYNVVSLMLSGHVYIYIYIYMNYKLTVQFSLMYKVLSRNFH